MKPEASGKRARLRGGTPRKGAPDGELTVLQAACVSRPPQPKPETGAEAF